MATDEEDGLTRRPWEPSFDETLLRQQIPSADVEQTIIRAHLWAEHFLIRLIEEGLPRPGNLDMDRVNFGTKVQIASALAVIPSHRAKSLMILNALRNRVAHKLDYKFSDADKHEFFYGLPKEVQGLILDGRSLDELSFGIILRAVVYLLDSIRHSNQEDGRIAKERVVQFRKKHRKTVARAYEGTGEKPPDWVYEE